MLVTLIHFLSPLKEVRHALHSPAPSGLQLVEGLARAGDRVGIRAHELLAPSPLLGDETGPLEHGHVLLHRREAHGISLRESGDRRLAAGAAANDVASSRVGQGTEQLVDLPGCQVIYNHSVVGYRSRPRRSRICTIASHRRKPTTGTK